MPLRRWKTQTDHTSLCFPQTALSSQHKLGPKPRQPEHSHRAAPPTQAPCEQQGDLQPLSALRINGLSVFFTPIFLFPFLVSCRAAAHGPALPGAGGAHRAWLTWALTKPNKNELRRILIF